PKVLPGALHVLDDPECAAHGPLLARGPGEADPRLEAAVVRVVERAARAVLAGLQDLSRGQVDVDLPVVLLDERGGVLPGEPQVHGQVATHPDVVLGEDADPLLDLREGSGIAAL